MKKVSIDKTTKYFIILIIAIVVFILSFVTLRTIIHPYAQQQTGYGMMGGVIPIQNNFYHTINISLSLLMAAIASLISNIYIKADEISSIPKKHINETEILKKALSSEEKKLVEEVEKAGEITQDSLRFRLEWSKAKVSSILTNLDRMGMIQRQREGKTYLVKMQKKK